MEIYLSIVFAALIVAISTAQASPFPSDSDFSAIQSYYKKALKPLTEEDRIYTIRELDKSIKREKYNIKARKLREEVSFGEGKKVIVAVISKGESKDWESLEFNRLSEVLGSHGIGFDVADGRGIGISVGETMQKRALELLLPIVKSEKLQINLLVETLKAEQGAAATP